MSIHDFLAERREAIVGDAVAAASRAPHYAAVGEDELWRRLDLLLDRLLDGIARRDLVPVAEYARALADLRFGAGYALAEVQVAINALEESVWQALAADLRPERLGDALAIVSTVLGSAKDALAQEYVRLAAGAAAPAVDVARLFGGTA